MNVAETVKILDHKLFVQAGRPAHYPKAKPREWTGRGLCVIDGGPPEGLGPHPMVVLHFSKDREVQKVGVAREGAEFKRDGFAGEERAANIGDAARRCLAILEDERLRHPAGAGWSRHRPVRVYVDGKACYVPINAADAKAACAALGVPAGNPVSLVTSGGATPKERATKAEGKPLEFPNGWTFNEGDEFVIKGLILEASMSDSVETTDKLGPWQNDPES